MTFRKKDGNCTKYIAIIKLSCNMNNLREKGTAPFPINIKGIRNVIDRRNTWLGAK